MNMINVDEIKFLGKKQKVTQYGTNVTSYKFIVTSATSHNPIYSIAVASGRTLSRDNELTQLDGGTELYIIKTMKEEIESNNQKKLAVIDLTAFPYIKAYIDYR